MERLYVAQKGPMGCGRKGGSLENDYGAGGSGPTWPDIGCGTWASFDGLGRS